MLAGVDLFPHLRTSAVVGRALSAGVPHLAFDSHLWMRGMDFLIEIVTDGVVLVPNTEVWMDGQYECHCGKAAK